MPGAKRKYPNWLLGRLVACSVRALAKRLVLPEEKMCAGKPEEFVFAVQ